MSKPPPLAESAWFWLLMFSSVALLGLVAIGPKYLRRQARTEQRYANRVQTWQTRSATSESSPAPESESSELADGPIMESRAPRASLAPLAGFVGLVMIVSAAGLTYSRRASASIRSTAPGESPDRST